MISTLFPLLSHNPSVHLLHSRGRVLLGSLPTVSNPVNIGSGDFNPAQSWPLGSEFLERYAAKLLPTDANYGIYSADRTITLSQPNPRKTTWPSL